MKRIVISVLSSILAICVIAGNVSAFADGWDTDPVCLEHSYSRTLKKRASMTADGYTALVCKNCKTEKENSRERIAQIASVTLAQEEYIYDGREKKPAVTVMDVDNNIIAAQNYTVTYFNNTDAWRDDTYARIIFKGNYTGTVNKTFAIVKNTGAICGQIDTEQVYHPVMVDLYLGETKVIGTAIQNDGTFFLDDLAPGTYSAKVCSVNSPDIEVINISVAAKSVTNLNESENAVLRNLRISLGDINGDAVIDFSDASVILANDIYGSDRNNNWYEERIDLNFDGSINVLDLGVLLQEGNYSAYEQTLQY